MSRFDVDGRTAPPLTTDQYRWQRVVFDLPEVMTYQRMSGELVDAPVKLDGNSLTVSGPDGSPLATLTASEPASDQLRLTGTLSGRDVTISLDRLDLDQFTLRNRGFHWVQEYPYFR